ncbi:FbpB family small basic protein [Metabacillus sp. KIGAM252]|uniref:FbpB family small basic protein n=1 Tax=Metabacillus flavus TaxID=2823519 RepID=A0ABS5LDU6_9BACI|nr:FbpB family small basic protein [Metabacillus flavus]MBS2968922.1 FbpB family small basic protein [Metabacillus flavus]
MRKPVRYSMEEFIRRNKQELTSNADLMEKLEERIEDRYTVVYPGKSKKNTQFADPDRRR